MRTRLGYYDSQITKEFLSYKPFLQVLLRQDNFLRNCVIKADRNVINIAYRNDL